MAICIHDYEWECAKCGNTLTVHVDYRNFITVEPCDNCIWDATERGRLDGYKERDEEFWEKEKRQCEAQVKSSSLR